MLGDELLARELLVRLGVFCPCRLDNVLRDLDGVLSDPASLFAPPASARFEPLAEELLVEPDHLVPFCPLALAPEAGRIRREALVDEGEGRGPSRTRGGEEAELEFGVGEDEAARERVRGGGAVEGEGVLLDRFREGRIRQVLGDCFLQDVSMLASVSQPRSGEEEEEEEEEEIKTRDRRGGC